jgi:nucleoside-diphosphate-sugar epimerase
MRIVVIGGSGHVGTYLIPRLVESGHEVINISRQQRTAYQPHGAWQQVRQVTLDRERAEQEGSFGAQVADLAPDAVVDMICF